LPTNGQAVPTGPQWVHEIKHDGYRFICRLERGRVRVFSRRFTLRWAAERRAE
jgi:bifunctional non-homologous end joining protein LigD